MAVFLCSVLHMSQKSSTFAAAKMPNEMPQKCRMKHHKNAQHSCTILWRMDVKVKTNYCTFAAESRLENV